MGSGQKFLTRIGSIFCSSSQVSHLWLGFGKFPLKMSNFSIFSLRIKKNLYRLGQKVPGSKAGQPLIYGESKVSLGRVKAHLYPGLTAAGSSEEMLFYCAYMVVISTGQKILTRVGSIFCGSGWVGSTKLEFGKFCLKMSNF